MTCKKGRLEVTLGHSQKCSTPLGICPGKCTLGDGEEPWEVYSPYSSHFKVRAILTVMNSKSISNFFITTKLLKKLNYALKPVTPGVRALNVAVKNIQTFTLPCMQSGWFHLWEKENCVFWQVAPEVSRFWAMLFKHFFPLAFSDLLCYNYFHSGGFGLPVGFCSQIAGKSIKNHVEFCWFEKICIGDYINLP